MPYLETKVYFDGSHYIGIPKYQKPSKALLWDYEPTYVSLWDNVWQDSSDEQLYPCVYESADEHTDVFWYDNGKKAIPLIEPNAELPQ